MFPLSVVYVSLNIFHLGSGLQIYLKGSCVLMLLFCHKWTAWAVFSAFCHGCAEDYLKIYKYFFLKYALSFSSMSPALPLCI